MAKPFPNWSITPFSSPFHLMYLWSSSSTTTPSSLGQAASRIVLRSCATSQFRYCESESTNDFAKVDFPTCRGPASTWINRRGSFRRESIFVNNGRLKITISPEQIYSTCWVNIFLAQNASTRNQKAVTCNHPAGLPARIFIHRLHGFSWIKNKKGIIMMG